MDSLKEKHEGASTPHSNKQHFETTVAKSTFPQFQKSSFTFTLNDSILDIVFTEESFSPRCGWTDSPLACLLFSGDKLMFKPFHHLFITSNRFQAVANEFEGKTKPVQSALKAVISEEVAKNQ